jgi:CRISPR-associated protein Csy2
MSRILLLPKLHIHNANALSSPYTIGFPAMTAWLGAVHALQRKLNQDEPDLRFTRVGVVCHQFKLQAHQGDYHEYVLIGTSNPLDKNGDRPSFIEEARCDLTVSLIIECENLPFDEDEWLETVPAHINANLKMAGGDLLTLVGTEKTSASQIQLLTVETDSELKKLTRRLMPSYTLIERRDLMIEAMQNGQDALNALLDYLSIQHRSEAIKDENGNIIKGEWTSTRKSKGWLVPIATGFHGITELGNAENQRDPNTPHRFAESVITLGEFKMPHKIKNLNELLWQSHYDAENNLYLIQQTH